MNMTIYPPEKQAEGFFDGGRIVEQKPIGFPGEGSAVKRVGPLFYWAWAEANEIASIPSHPHKAFEILTYVIKGEVEHGDSLGTSQRVIDGGVQVIQAGSGVYHSEKMCGGKEELFQIWFEPDIRQTIKQAPTYNQYDHEQFPIQNINDVRVKTVIGEGAPISLVTTAKMFDVEIPADQTFSFTISSGKSLAVIVVRGNGALQQPKTGDEATFQYRDFVVITADEDEEIQVAFQAIGEENLRIVCIEVPAEVNYPLYTK